MCFFLLICVLNIYVNFEYYVGETLINETICHTRKKRTDSRGTAVSLRQMIESSVPLEVGIRSQAVYSAHIYLKRVYFVLKSVKQTE